jgi:hypothetical protein
MESQANRDERLFRPPFCSQAFRMSCCLRRPELQEPIFRLMAACSGYRQAARVLGCAHSTVLNQTRRLGRHCLLVQHLKAPPKPPAAPIVVEGFRSFGVGDRT